MRPICLEAAHLIIMCSLVNCVVIKLLNQTNVSKSIRLKEVNLFTELRLSSIKSYLDFGQGCFLSIVLIAAIQILTNSENE